MTNPNNLYNILAAFNAATKPEEAATPKQVAQKIYESIESQGSIMGGVRGVEKKLSEAFANHKVSEAGNKPVDKQIFGMGDSRSARDLKSQMAGASDEFVNSTAGKTPGALNSKVAHMQTKLAKSELRNRSRGVAEGKMSDLDYDLKAKEVSDAEFKKKYGKTKAEMRASMATKKKVAEGRVKELTMDLEEMSAAEFLKKYKKTKAEMRKSMKEDIAEGVAETLPMSDAVKVLRQYGADHFKTGSETLYFYKNGKPFNIDLIWNDDSTRSVSLSQLNAATRRLKGQGVDEGILDEPATTQTDTGRIHRAKQGGYGNRYGSDEELAAPPEQIARGRGRPKKLELELKRQAAAARAAAAGGAPAGRGRPKKAQPGGPDSAPAGTLGLHNFLFGPAPAKLPGKPGVKHKISDTGSEQSRVAKITGESIRESARPSTLKGYLAESVGADALDQIEQRFKHEVKSFAAGADMDQDLYEALFDYYANTGEMPYGVMKGRSGDPYEWVCEKFDEELASTAGYDPEMGEAVDPLAVPAYKRKAAGQAPLSLDQVRAPRADSLSDVRNLGGDTARRDTKALNDLARLAGITTESVSVISGDYDGDGDHDMQDHAAEHEQESSMNISTNQSSTGTKTVTVTADGEAAVALLSMLKMAGMGGSDAAAEQEAIIVSSGESDCGDTGIEMEEEYANEPAPQYQSVEKITSAGDDMNRQKKQNYPLRAPGNNPMSESDPVKSMGRDLMAEYQAMKIKK